MKLNKCLPLLGIFLISITTIQSQQNDLANSNDSLTLAQAFINLSLTQTYFDSISLNRVDKIIPFEQNELTSIQKKTFKDENKVVYNLAYSMLYFIKAKRLSKVTNKPTRQQLLKWKTALDSSYYFFNTSGINYSYFEEKITDPYFELIGLNEKVYRKLNSDLSGLRTLFSIYFNLDIYPDYKRIFYTAKNSNVFYFDSLIYYASMYSIPVYLSVLKDIPSLKKELQFKQSSANFVGRFYNRSQGLDLIAKYLQYYYLASNKVSDSITLDPGHLYGTYSTFISELNPEDSSQFSSNDGIIGKDDFFAKELNEKAVNDLLNRLKVKFPPPTDYTESHGNTSGNMKSRPSNILKYYFPNPAPFPSAAVYIDNFKPAHKSMRQVDNYLKPIFTNAGYNGHLRYYYVKSGFAMTTNLEKINSDGSPVAGTARWDITPGGSGSFSLYQVFRSIFLKTESNFRIFAFIIAPQRPDISPRPPALSAMSDLVEYSYPSLPADIEDSVLSYKVLSILVYHFVQSDIGEVPMLVTKNALPVQQHLRSSKLAALLVP